MRWMTADYVKGGFAGADRSVPCADEPRIATERFPYLEIEPIGRQDPLQAQPGAKNEAFGRWHSPECAHVQARMLEAMWGRNPKIATKLLIYNV